jgi:hypothetical protein
LSLVAGVCFVDPAIVSKFEKGREREG